MSTTTMKKKDLIAFSVATIVGFVLVVYYDFDIFDKLFGWMF